MKRGGSIGLSRKRAFPTGAVSRPVVVGHERQFSGSTESLDVFVVHGDTRGIPVHLREECPIGENVFTELLDFRLRVAPTISIAKRSGIFVRRKLKGHLQLA